MGPRKFAGSLGFKAGDGDTGRPNETRRKAGQSHPPRFWCLPPPAGHGMLDGVWPAWLQAMVSGLGRPPPAQRPPLHARHVAPSPATNRQFGARIIYVQIVFGLVLPTVCSTIRLSVFLYFSICMIERGRHRRFLSEKFSTRVALLLNLLRPLKGTKKKGFKSAMGHLIQIDRFCVIGRRHLFVSGVFKCKIIRFFGGHFFHGFFGAATACAHAEFLLQISDHSLRAFSSMWLCWWAARHLHYFGFWKAIPKNEGAAPLSGTGPCLKNFPS